MFYCKIDRLVFTMHKTLVGRMANVCSKYFAVIFRIGIFDVVGPGHLRTVPTP